MSTEEVRESSTATAETYKAAFRRHPGGVAVITADPGDGPVGLTLTSVTSVSIDPPLLLFSLSDISSSTPSILRSETVVVHLLDSDGIGIAKLCATSGIDRFADESIWSRLPSGEPHFHDVSNWLRCRIRQRVPAGRSTIVVAEVIEIGAGRVDEPVPLVYHDRGWYRLHPSHQLQ